VFFTIDHGCVGVTLPFANYKHLIHIFSMVCHFIMSSICYAFRCKIKTLSMYLITYQCKHTFYAFYNDYI